MKLTDTSLACPSWTIEEVVSAAEHYGYAAIEWRLADGAIIEPIYALSWDKCTEEVLV